MAETRPSGKALQSEEEYFYKVNRELIESKRKSLDALRAEQEKAARKAQHWMKCPKCGGQMNEFGLSGIMVEACAECHGIYFDHAELELLLKARERNGFWHGVKRLFQ